MSSRSTKYSALRVLTGAALGGAVANALVDTLPTIFLIPGRNVLSSPYVAIGVTLGALLGMKKRPARRGQKSDFASAELGLSPVATHGAAANDAEFHKPRKTSLPSIFGLPLPAIVHPDLK